MAQAFGDVNRTLVGYTARGAKRAGRGQLLYDFAGGVAGYCVAENSVPGLIVIQADGVDELSLLVVGQRVDDSRLLSAKSWTTLFE